LDPSDLIGLLDVIDLFNSIGCHYFFFSSSSGSINIQNNS